MNLEFEETESCRESERVEKSVLCCQHAFADKLCPHTVPDFERNPNKNEGHCASPGLHMLPWRAAMCLDLWFYKDESVFTHFKMIYRFGGPTM